MYKISGETATTAYTLRDMVECYHEGMKTCNEDNNACGECLNNNSTFRKI